MRRPSLWPAIIGTGTALVLALFLVIVVRDVDEMRRLRDDTFSIEHSLEVQRELDGLLVGETEADAAVRGYIITGSTAVLMQFRSAQHATTAHLNRLAELTADNPRNKSA